MSDNVKNTEETKKVNLVGLWTKDEKTKKEEFVEEQLAVLQGSADAVLQNLFMKHQAAKKELVKTRVSALKNADFNAIVLAETKVKAIVIEFNNVIEVYNMYFEDSPRFTALR